jgi:hypothetical protein
MQSTSKNRDELLRIATATLQVLESGAFAESLAAGAPEAVAEAAGPPRDTVTYALSAALDWARLENQVRAAAPSLEAAGPGGNLPYIPSNQVLSLLQSAYDEYIEERAAGETEQPFDTTDPGWISVAWEKLKAIFRGKRRFIAHTNNTDFRIDLPDNAVVALFSDWGTGEPTAQRVLQQIRNANPTHAIHLGDIYYSGTPREVQTRFLDVIDRHGPPRNACRYFSLNANHDMYSGGYGYFDSVLPRFGQPASYFNLRNPNWRLIGLDSGYEDHGLQDPQSAWLSAQLSEPGGKSILLSHHQFFSSYEPRAYDRALHRKVTPVLAGVFAWFWGHEHKCVIFGDHLGIKARCIGHGAIPANVPFGPPDFPNVPVFRSDERPAPDGEGGNIHGFALLRFSGRNLAVSYIDEFGQEFFSERFQA